MVTKIILTFSLAIGLLSCNGQNMQNGPFTVATPIHINRFDKEVFRLIETNDTSRQVGIEQQYPQMLNVLGQGILNMKNSQVTGFFDKLVNYYSEPTLKGLYQDAINRFDSPTGIEEDLGNGFAWLKVNFPGMQIPAVYMHVSGLNQNILVGDSLLSLSIDKYMGKDYPLYQEFFYDYQREKMQETHIVPDYLAGWLMAEYPFQGNENVLLDRMIYEGKINYLLRQALPELKPEVLPGYTEAALNWCTENESNLWKAIINRKHLYTPDHLVTAKYFEDTPSTFLSSDAPGNIGVWLGGQIIDKYMKETGATPEALMKNNNSQEILTVSKYKP